MSAPPPASLVPLPVPGRIKRGEVWLAALDPTVGREIQKTRPCLIVSPDEMNAHLATATVLPMTTGSRPARWRIPIRFQRKDGLALGDQMRTLDQARLVKRLGRAEASTIQAALAMLREMFAD